MADILMNLFGSGTGGDENALAQIDVPQNGVIKGVQWNCNIDFDADAEQWVAEVSFISTLQARTNDARGLISAIQAQANFTTSGMAVNALNYFFPLNLVVAGGERLFLNTSSSGGVTSRIGCIISLEQSRTTVRRSARRA